MLCVPLMNEVSAIPKAENHLHNLPPIWEQPWLKYKPFLGTGTYVRQSTPKEAAEEPFGCFCYQLF